MRCWGEKSNQYVRKHIRKWIPDLIGPPYQLTPLICKCFCLDESHSKTNPLYNHQIEEEKNRNHHLSPSHCNKKVTYPERVESQWFRLYNMHKINLDDDKGLSTYACT